MEMGETIRFTEFEEEFFNRKKILKLLNKRNNTLIFDECSKNKSYIRSSQLPKECKKELVLLYHMKKYGNITLNDNVNPNYNDSAAVGTYLHEILQNDLNNCCYIEDTQRDIEVFFINETLKITGHIDFITKNSLICKENFTKEEDFYVVGEIKTVKDEDFKKIEKKNIIPYKYLEQNNMYITEMNKIYGNVHKSLFIIKNRSNNKELCFLYSKDKSIIESNVNKCKEIIKYIENNKIPDSSPIYKRLGNNVVPTGMCIFCRFSHFCKNLQNISDLERLNNIR